jgi:hypothetical protein
MAVKLVELLKHGDVEGKKLTWNLQVNASAVTVKLIWIKIENPIATYSYFLYASHITR